MFEIEVSQDHRVGAFYTPPTYTLEVTGSPSVAVGTPEEFTARLLDAEGTPAPISGTFMVPIEDANGTIVKVKGVTFTDGVATASVTFERSGYYRITEAGVNSKLDGTMRIATPGFAVTCFE